MRRILWMLSGLALLFGTLVSGEEVPARMTLSTGKTLVGALTARLPGAVHFKREADGQTINIPDSYVQQIRYSLKGYDSEILNALFEGGNYHELIELYETQLAPMLPYAALPSNLDREAYLHWMIAAYWIGQPARVLELVDLVPSEFELQGRYYRGLAQLEEGTPGALEALLKQSDVDTVYPIDSAARLYLEARQLQLRNDSQAAIRTAARLIVLHGNDTDWMPRAELLCAELYFKLKMPASAQAVLADIREFYSNPDVQRKAAALAAQNNGEEK